jgi:hypothetical protein
MSGKATQWEKEEYFHSMSHVNLSFYLRLEKLVIELKKFTPESQKQKWMKKREKC